MMGEPARVPAHQSGRPLQPLRKPARRSACSILYLTCLRRFLDTDFRGGLGCPGWSCVPFRLVKSPEDQTVISRGLAWWDRLRLLQKVWTILLMIFIPMVGGLVVHVSLIKGLLNLQQQHQQTVLAREHIRVLRRLAVDIEDAFRGYLLTKQDSFLEPLKDAKARLGPTVDQTLSLTTDSVPDLVADVRRVTDRLTALLESKDALIRRFEAGQSDEVLSYVRSGEGLRLSDALGKEFRAIEDRLERRTELLDVEEGKSARRAFWGLLVMVVATLAVGLLGAKWLTRSITQPLALLQASMVTMGKGAEPSPVPTSILIRSSDEIGQFARAFEDMGRRIRLHLKELEPLIEAGREIHGIGSDGLDQVLKRIAGRAAETFQADACLVLLRSDQLGSWVVEAASGKWSDRLYKAVVPWEESPVSVRAFETKKVAIGEELRGDVAHEGLRRNLISASMLSIPLLSQGVPFGVLTFVQERPVPRESWNIQLAEGFAEEAAVAIAAARLSEATQQRGKGLVSRLRQLEHLAEALAHDLKAPGERMEGLASMLLEEYGGKLDERATRWLALIEANGKELSERVEDILQVARVGVRQDAVEAVDPAPVINEVLQSMAADLERRHVRVQVQPGFPMVACHRAYLRQVLDNLVSNALKFSGGRPDFRIWITAEQREHGVRFSVADNGVGIPPEDRERVFEPFVRLSPASAKGSGIGLAIVKRIIELYEGRVWIEDNEYSGCTVSFTLPALAELSRAGAEAGAMPGAQEPALARGAEVQAEQAANQVPSRRAEGREPSA